MAIISWIPNFITCCNLAAGCLSIIAASKGLDPFWGLRGFEWAFIFIGIGAIADFLDGLAARLLMAYSNLGKELDSLSDLVTFGVAPALTLFFLLEGMMPDDWVRWTVFLIPVSGALRLARFNLDTRQTTSFIGLPIPANAIFWIGFATLLDREIPGLMDWYVFLPILIVECWLMNSRIRMFSLKFKNLRFRDNYLRYLLIIAAAVFCFTLQAGGLMWLIVFYVFTSIAFKDKVR